MNKLRINRIFHKKEKGQILIVLGFMLVGLIAIVGLALDLGTMYVQYSRLRRAVDAAALSASSHFRQGYTPQSLIDSAQQFLNLNEIIDTTDISIDTCDTLPEDPILCTTPPPKDRAG